MDPTHVHLWLESEARAVARWQKDINDEQTTGFFRCDLNELKLHTHTHSCTGSRKQLAHCNVYDADEEPLLSLKREMVK